MFKMVTTQFLAAPYNLRLVARKEETLEEKLTCSICGEREKNRVFACGHPSCQECAVAWRRCFYNCTSERRDKPVKHHFPLYL